MLKTVWEKILAGLAAVGMFLAAVFYFLWDKKRAEALKETNKNKVSTAELEAKKKSEERHEKAKQGGGVSVASDIADMLDDK